MNHVEVVYNLRQIIGKYPLTHGEWQALEHCIDFVCREKEKYDNTYQAWLRKEGEAK